MSHSSLRKLAAPASILSLALVALSGCADGANCSISTNDDGDAELRCLDGSVFVIPDGNTGDAGERGGPGAPGKETTSCVITTNEDASRTLTCGETSITLERGSVACEGGFPGDLRVQSDRNTDEQDEFPPPSVSYLLFELTDCDEIHGDLIIEGYREATLPPRIEALARVGGELRIGALYGHPNTGLTSPRFHRLLSVGETLHIDDNPDIIGILDAFPVLERADAIIIENNPNLASIEGFSRLQEVGLIEIRYNAGLEEIGDFPALIEADSIHIRGNNEALLRVGSFDELTTINVLNIADSPTLTDIGRFPRLKTHHSELRLRGYDALTTLPEFPALEYAAHVRITHNALVEHIPGFPLLQLPEDGILTIQNNHAARTIGDFPSLTDVMGILIYNNQELTSIGSFDGLEEIKHLHINHSPILVDGGTFPELHTVRWVLDIRSVGLTTLPRFQKLAEIGTIEPQESGGGLYLRENPNLDNIDGFEVLALIESHLEIVSNPNLPSVDVNAIVDMHDDTTGVRLVQNNGP